MALIVQLSLTHRHICTHAAETCGTIGLHPSVKHRDQSYL